MIALSRALTGNAWNMLGVLPCRRALTNLNPTSRRGYAPSDPAEFLSSLRRLNGKADCNLMRSVKHLKQLVTSEAVELPLFAAP